MNRTLNSVLLALSLVFLILIVYAVNIEADKVLTYQSSGVKQVMLLFLVFVSTGFIGWLLSKRDKANKLSRIARRIWEEC